MSKIIEHSGILYAFLIFFPSLNVFVNIFEKDKSAKHYNLVQCECDESAGAWKNLKWRTGQ